MAQRDEAARQLRARERGARLPRKAVAHPGEVVDQGNRLRTEDRAQVDLGIAQASLAQNHPIASRVRASFRVGHLATLTSEDGLSDHASSTGSLARTARRTASLSGANMA